MSAQIKQRVIGGLVLLALLAIFLPLFFNNPHPSANLAKNVPAEPVQPTVELQLPQVAKQEIDDSQPIPNPMVTDSQPVVVAAQQPSNASAVSTSPQAPSEPVNQQKAAVVTSAAESSKPIKVAAAALPKTDHGSNAIAVVPVKQAYHQLVHAKAWVLQLASFGHKDNANRLVAKLRQSGYQAYTREVKRSGGASIYKVFVGPEINRDRVELLQDQLQKQYKLKGMVRRYQA